MRVTANQAQTERKRQARSVCCTEKRRCRARNVRVLGPICPTPDASATSGAAQGKKYLISGQIETILPSKGRPLGGCRYRV